MYINEVCKLTGLTKKAVEYYEQQGLLRPEIMENGYRKYGEGEISDLKEIALLKKLGIGISDIKAILTSYNKPDSLAECKSKMIRQIETLNVQRDCLDYLIDNGYDIDDSFQYVMRQLDENNVIKDRLKEAFPGKYGLFVSLHFGRFLNEKIDSPEKEAAYGKTLEFLDNLADIPFPRELEVYLVEATAVWDEKTMHNLDSGTKEAIDDYDGFIEKNKETLKWYLDYCNSDEYKDSPAYKMKKLMLEFQQNNGYYDIFIKNMKILSREYAKYVKKAQKANDRFLSEHPNYSDILGYNY